VQRLIGWVLGPELYWVAWYGLTVAVARLNVPPSEAGNAWLERIGMWLLPLVSVPLSFWLLFGLMSPSQSRGWLWARLALATFVGLNACLFHLADAIDYQDSRNSGVLGVWMMGLIVGSLLFVIASGVPAFRAGRG
jgi:hypothetical protein